MNHGDAKDIAPLSSVWIHERKKGKEKGSDRSAKLGHMGTIANCVAGDIVACESIDRKRIIWLEIAWQWPDGKAAQVRLYDRRTGGISTEARHLRTVKSTQRVRFLGVRAR